MSVLSTVQQLIEECYACERAGEISRAFQRAQAAVEAARASRDAETIACALTSQAYIEYRLGHFERAHALAEEALACAPPACEARATALRLLGDCAHEQGDLAAAEKSYHQAINVGRQLGLTYLLHRCLHSLSACVYIPRGQFDLALAADEESIHLAEQAGLFEDLWLPLLTTAWTLWVMGRQQSALAAVATLQSRVSPQSLGEGYLFCLKGDLAQESDDAQSAVEWYNRARQIAEIVGDPGLNIELRLGLSRYYRSAGNTPAAYDWAADALKITELAGCHDLKSTALIERGRAAWERGELCAAEQDLRAAIQMLTPMQANFDLARARLLLAGLLYQGHEAEARVAWFEAATCILHGGYDDLLERERALVLPLLSAFMSNSTGELADTCAALSKCLAQAPPPALQVTTLGGFSVRHGRTVIPESAWQRRAGELFRLLLVSPGRCLSRDQIIEALWPHSSSTAATQLFHRATSTLRRVLEPDLPDKFPSRYLEVSQGAVYLRLPPNSWIDFEAFQAHIAAEEWRSALEIYHGDLLTEDAYADWAVGLREKLKQSAMRAALEQAQACLKRQDYQAALAASRRAIELEPWQEQAVLLGMQACLGQNDRISAIRMYQALERSLGEELGIEPEAQVQQLYRSIL